jgi:hypothetical protein
MGVLCWVRDYFSGGISIRPGLSPCHPSEIIGKWISGFVELLPNNLLEDADARLPNPRRI